MAHWAGGHRRAHHVQMAKILVCGARQMESGVQVVSQRDGRQHVGAARPGALPHGQSGVHHQRAGMKAGTGVLHTGVLGQLPVDPRRYLRGGVVPGTQQDRVLLASQIAGVSDQAFPREPMPHERDANMVDEHRPHEVRSIVGDAIPISADDLLGQGSRNTHR